MCLIVTVWQQGRLVLGGRCQKNLITCAKSSHYVFRHSVVRCQITAYSLISSWKLLLTPLSTNVHVAPLMVKILFHLMFDVQGMVYAFTGNQVKVVGMIASIMWCSINMRSCWVRDKRHHWESAAVSIPLLYQIIKAHPTFCGHRCILYFLE